MIYIYIKYNLNKDSLNYKKIGVSTMDGHGRQGIYIINKFNTFDKFKTNIEIHYNAMLTCFYKSGWTAFYNNVINLMMDEMGMMIKYG
jgi:hypothetical protein